MRLFDSHCHLDFPVFDGDRADVLARAAAAGVSDLLVPGYAPSTWSRADALAQAGQASAPRVHVAVGLHPHALAAVRASDRETTDGTGDAPGDVSRGAPPAAPATVGDARAVSARPAGALTQQLVDAAGRLGALAIGECGLDGPLAKRGSGGVPLALQERVLVEHLRAADATGLPLILHVVGAHEAALVQLKRGGARASQGSLRGVVHAFSGSAEVARNYLRLGFKLAFGGALTHPHHKRAREVAAALPDDALLVESDAPSGRLAGGPARNEPSAVRQVVAALAALRGQPPEHVAEVTSRNAQALFRLGAAC